MTSNPTTVPPQRYCALAYAEQERGAILSPETHPVVLVLVRSVHTHRILVNPNWRSFVRPPDSPYIGELLEDWKQRLAEDPESLFLQLSSLNTGPLIVIETGPDLASAPSMLATIESFQEY
jgi:hypothetical protein